MRRTHEGAYWCLELAKVRNPMNLANDSALSLLIFKKIAGNVWPFLGKSLPLQLLTNQQPLHTMRK